MALPASGSNTVEVFIRGTPFPPLFFNILSDVLQQLLLASSECLLLHPLVDDLPCPLLQYVANLICVLDEFSAATGLSINYHKSTFVPFKTVSHCFLHGFLFRMLGFELPANLPWPSTFHPQALSL
jgi:hypothetical protein